MARQDRRRIFEELGLLNEPEPTNPYKTLGLDPAFAGELLREDPSGEMIRLAAGALRQALAKRYHPDVPKTGNADRFREIDEANSRIQEAQEQQGQKITLARWSRVEQSGVPSSQLEKARTERESLVTHAAELFQTNLELGNHPQHFSQLQWTQGALLQRGSSALLLQQLPEGGVQIARGDSLKIGEVKQSLEESQAFDFPAFLRQHELFGLEPGSKIVAYVDQEHRASILAPDLSFIMDITVPVTEHREKRKRIPQGQNDPSFWARARSPVLFITSVPVASQVTTPKTQIITFSDIKDSARSAAWELPLEVAGTVSDQDFFNRMRYTKNVGATAIVGNAQYTMQHFNLIATPARKFIENDPKYSPVLLNGSSLVLYDPTNDTPVVTDAKVIGMIGSNSRAA